MLTFTSYTQLRDTASAYLVSVFESGSNHRLRDRSALAADIGRASGQAVLLNGNFVSPGQ